MPSVVVLRIETISLPHAVRQTALRRLNQEMVMVIHEAIRVAEPVIALDDLGEEGKEALPVCIIRVNGSARIAAAGHMIQSARKFETQGSCHRCTLLSIDKAEKAISVSTQGAVSCPGRRRSKAAQGAASASSAARAYPQRVG